MSIKSCHCLHEHDRPAVETDRTDVLLSMCFDGEASWQHGAVAERHIALVVHAPHAIKCAPLRREKGSRGWKPGSSLKEGPR